MGGIIPRQIKEQVIRGWIDGYLRDRIAKKNGVGEGTVTNIVQDACKQAEYHDMPLFRHLALKLNENGLEPIYLALAIRIKKVTEENFMNVDQADRIISEIATYCYKHGISVDGLIKSGQEAIMLQEIYRIQVASIPERIFRQKKDLDSNEECRAYNNSYLKHGIPVKEPEIEVIWNVWEERGKWQASEPGIDLPKILRDVYDHPVKYKKAIKNLSEIYDKTNETL